jgi:hypothetical protein
VLGRYVRIWMLCRYRKKRTCLILVYDYREEKSDNRSLMLTLMEDVVVNYFYDVIEFS